MARLETLKADASRLDAVLEAWLQAFSEAPSVRPGSQDAIQGSALVVQSVDGRIQWRIWPGKLVRVGASGLDVRALKPGAKEALLAQLEAMQ